MANIAYWSKACRHLAEADPILGNVIQQHKTSRLQVRDEPFHSLARTVVGQQISVKAADSIWRRLEQLCAIQIHAVLAQDINTLRGCGLSRSKAEYLQNVARFFEKTDWQQLRQCRPEEIRSQLLAIKGIGEWSWEMFAIFCLQLPDIFPIRDLGMVNACKKLYGFANNEEIIQFAHRWKPYRTVATWYLWRSIDPLEVSY